MRIIGLAPNSWHGLWVNRQQLLSRLGLKHNIVYSMGTWTVWERGTPEWRAAPPFGAMRPSDNVMVDEAPKFLLRWPRWSAYDSLVVKMQARRLSSFRPDDSPLLTLVFHPSLLPYARNLPSDFVAYHAYDLFEATPGWSQQDEAFERSLLDQADLVTAVSEGIAGRLREKVPREVRILPNGVDIQSFDDALLGPAKIPEELARIPHPRLGYIGSLHPQVDYGLIARMAMRNPSWNFVLVGARIDRPDERARSEFAECGRLANVHFLGEVHRSAVPALAVGMDVHLMPYRLSDETWIKAIYPLKLHEYLATGKPVVSADVPSVRQFRRVVRIAVDADDWERAISDALAFGGSGSSEERRAVAAANTWDARAACLDNWISELAERAH